VSWDFTFFQENVFFSWNIFLSSSDFSIFFFFFMTSIVTTKILQYLGDHLDLMLIFHGDFENKFLKEMMISQIFYAIWKNSWSNLHYLHIALSYSLSIDLKAARCTRARIETSRDAAEQIRSGAAERERRKIAEWRNRVTPRAAHTVEILHFLAQCDATPRSETM